MASESEETLSTVKAARLLEVGASTVKRWADEGLLPCVRTAGGHRRFARQELERWLRERGGAPPAQPARTGELVPTRSEPRRAPRSLS